MVELTQTEQLLLEYTGDFWVLNGFAPSVRDLLGVAPSVNATSAVNYHLKILVNAGYLLRLNTAWRNVRLAPAAFQLLRSTDVITRLCLPYPVSVNRLWSPRKGGGLRLSDEGKTYKERAAWEAQSQVIGRDLLFGKLAYSARYYRPAERGDLDNLPKAMLDSMNQVVYKDYSQFVESHTFFDFDDARPRVEIEIWRVQR